MTNEEAIRWLQLDIDMMKFDPFTGEDAYLNDDAKKTIEALDMAIDALRNEQKAEELLLKSDPDSVSNDDVVYRQLATILSSRIKCLSSMSNKYHVGLGVFGIYAGILKNKEEWKDKSEVTIEAIDAVAGFLLTNEKECRFEWQGKEYVMRVEEYQEDTDE